MGDIGKPERIVEDEPISWPDEEPLTVPAPAPAEPVPAGAAMGASLFASPSGKLPRSHAMLAQGREVRER